MRPALDTHPSDNSLEDYARGTLDAGVAELVRQHLETCHRCCRSVDEIRRFVAALAVADAELRSRPLSFIHHTEQGPVRLVVKPGASGDWVAMVAGATVELLGRHNDVWTANDQAIRAFEEMFPEHRCTCRCGPAGPP
jgi:anti-sigma factor RsiW